MKNASPTFHYQEIMQNLQDYCENKNSGTLFITTTNNHSIRFVLKQGIIVFLAYRFKQGKDALPLIKKIESGVFSFKKDTFAGKDDPTLLDTDTILNALSNKKTPPKSNNKTKAKKELVSKMLIISDDDIDKIKTELALFIGPVAQMVFDEYIDDYGMPSSHPQIEKMLAIFAEEINDEERKKQFETSAKSLSDKYL